MKYPFRLVSILTSLIFLWTSPSHAITLHVSDDQSVRIDRPTSSPNRHRHTPWKSRLGNFYSMVVKNTTLSIQSHRSGYEEQGFVKFDLSPLPPDGHIERATLRFWLNKVQKPGMLRLHEVLANWQEDTIHANQLPPTAPAFEGLAIEKNDNNQFMTIDVTTLVKDWLNNPTTNFGLALVSDQADPLRIKLDSKENTYTSHPMEIEVTLMAGVGNEGPPDFKVHRAQQEHRDHPEPHHSSSWLGRIAQLASSSRVLMPSETFSVELRPFQPILHHPLP